MQKRRPKRINKLRGRRAAGYGRSAGHRASGQRGGKGRAGSKKHHYIKVIMEDPNYFGKHGFKRPEPLVSRPQTINVGAIDQMVDTLVERGLAEKKGRKYTVDVSRLGVDKILGGGRVTHVLELTGVQAVSERAREKVEGAGGSIELVATNSPS